jgi:hypothetical protein
MSSQMKGVGVLSRLQSETSRLLCKLYYELRGVDVWMELPRQTFSYMTPSLLGARLVCLFGRGCI